MDFFAQHGDVFVWVSDKSGEDEREQQVGILKKMVDAYKSGANQKLPFAWHSAYQTPQGAD